MVAPFVLACFGDASDGAPDPPTLVTTSDVGGHVRVDWSGGSVSEDSRIYVNGLFLTNSGAGVTGYQTGFPIAAVTCVQVSHISDSTGQIGRASCRERV